MNRFQGANILVTDGTSGIGYAAALRFLEERAQVAIAGGDEERLREAKRSLGRGREERVFTILSDASQLEEISKQADRVQSIFGSLDALFINAGVGHFVPISETTGVAFDTVVDTNFKGVFFTAQSLLPILVDEGSSIINASWTMHRGMASSSVYAASKAAVQNLARTMSMELSPRNIRVNSVSPGYIETSQFNGSDLTREQASALLDQIALRRFGTSQEVAAVVAFLSSRDAAYVNGIDIIVDGGMVTTSVWPN